MYPASQPLGLDGWLRALTLTNTYTSDGLRPGFEQSWSLGTELSWYVFVPLFGVVGGLLVRRLGGARGYWTMVGMLASSILVTAGWRYWIHIEELGKAFTYSFWLPGFLVCFALGALGALVGHLLEGEQAGMISLRRLRAWCCDPWLAAGLWTAIALVATSSLAGPDIYTPATFTEQQLRFVCATALALILLVVGVLGSPLTPIGRLLGSRFLVAMGRWSYGIYLWHLPVIVLIEAEFTHRSGVTGGVLWLLVVLLISIPLGAATYAWVESPAIAWSKRGSRARS